MLHLTFEIGLKNTLVQTILCTNLIFGLKVRLNPLILRSQYVTSYLSAIPYTV